MQFAFCDSNRHSACTLQNILHFQFYGSSSITQIYNIHIWQLYPKRMSDSRLIGYLCLVNVEDLTTIAKEKLTSVVAWGSVRNRLTRR